ncbi:MAG: coproporphyrinogen dehydrogenase HemZ [Lachnospiraceae bacterium]|nr:coproporphyrinogen dehydrogenase HemZ [Lachnospiraceae bacterium]
MIAVILNREGFEYDIHSLVKAFFPQSEVKVFVEGAKSIVSDPGLPMLKIVRSSGMAKLLLYEWEERTDGVFAEGAEPEESVKGEWRQSVLEQVVLPPDTTKSGIRNALKQLLYRTLSEYTGKKLPWGTLTGIRPTKIAMGLLEEGAPESEILRYMKDSYYLSEEKGRLGIEIAKREKEILSGIHYREGYSLYIGIPFCPTTCLYCSFTSYPICAWKDRVREYLDALFLEIDDTAEIFQGRILDSVYIGGGTPTTLCAEELERLLCKLKSTFDFSHVKEFTVEAGRADSITEDKLLVLKEYGVSRISVNPQTMNQETLKLIGRQHTVEQVRDAFHLARRCGFTNINMDLILGLPGENEDDVQATAKAVRELDPDSLTVHSLAIKKASKLSQWIVENGVQTIHNTDGMMRIAAGAAAEMGMQPYYLYRQKNMSGNFENVGYAREGCYGIYNILIMEEKQTIAALGAGSISKRVYPDGRIERCDNVKEVEQYIGRIGEMAGRKRKLFADL